MPPEPPPLEMFADRVDIVRHVGPAQNDAGGRIPNPAMGDANEPCSIQYFAYRLTPEMQAVGTISEVPVFFRRDVGLKQNDVLKVLDANQLPTGEAMQVQRFRYQNAGDQLHIWVADCRINR